MVRTRNRVYIGSQEVKKRYIGNKLIFENLGDKTGRLSGTEIYTDKSDDSVVHIEIDGKSYQDGDPSPDYPIEIHSLNDFDVVSSTEKLSEGQLEEYNYDTEYENVYKINLSLDEPLRSVGDVKDRIFRDSDGLWKVERNVGEVAFDGTENWGVWYSRDTSGMFGLLQRNLKEPMLKTDGLIISNLFPSMNVNTVDEEGITIGTAPRLRVRAFYERVGTTPDSTDAQKINSFKQWLSNIYTEGVPLTIVYEVESPITETLDQELQDKLNNLHSFEDSNYVYTITNEENLNPTLHTTFKSKDWYDYYKKTLLK